MDELTVDESNGNKRSRKRKSLKRKWRPVALDDATLLAGDDMEGFVSLEELVDYDMNDFCADQTAKEDDNKEQSSQRKKKKKKKKKKKDPKVKEGQDNLKSEVPVEEDASIETEEFGMDKWNGLGVPSLVLKALADLKFDGPTPVQSLTLPAAILYKRDVVGAAETGSGKTLAFGIPLLQKILSIKESLKTNCDKKSFQGDSCNKEEIETLATGENEVNVQTANGADDENKKLVDLSPNKKRKKRRKRMEKNSDEEVLDKEDNEQTSLVEKKSDISTGKMSHDNPLLGLILAPTRELALQVKNHLQAAAKYTGIKIAAIVGGMAPQKQVRLLRQQPEVIVATPGRLWELISQGEDHVSRLNLVKVLVLDEADRMVEEGHFAELSSILELLDKKPVEDTVSSVFDELSRQSFVFSATLTLPKEKQKQVKKKAKSKQKKQGLDLLMEKVNFNDKPKIVDLTSKQATAQTLQEARITCNTEDKDVYLYYFLLKYPGRTLVFVNTIDSLRRLVSILNLLEQSPLPLHASMQQRQRLKNLDRFCSNSKGLLIATDVAARGLDIPNVQHVIHYQVPSNPEVYVHRSGRTARISHEGLSVVIVGPDDLTSYKGIIKTLNRDEHLPTFPVEISYVSAVRKRVSVARQIDKEENRVRKAKSTNNWFINNAKAMDIELDEDLLEDLGDSRQQMNQDRKLHKLKDNLAELLKTDVIPLGFSGKYPTQAGRLVMPGIPGAASTDNKELMATEVVKKKRKKV